jgi:hypothetical protein
MSGPDLLGQTLYDTAKALSPPPGLGAANLRQVQVASRDAATKTCRVYVDGDTTSPVPCGVPGPGVVPVVGALGWALQNRSDLLLLGTAAGLPKAKLYSVATQSPSAGVATKFDFNAAGGATMWDTDSDGLNTMVDRTNSRIYARWPGIYLMAASIQWAANASGISSVLLDIKDETGTFLHPRHSRRSDTVGGAETITGSAQLVAGQYLEFFITSTVQTRSFGGDSGHDLGATFWVAYLP